MHVFLNFWRRKKCPKNWNWQKNEWREFKRESTYLDASIEVCCSHNVSQSGFIPFIPTQASGYETLRTNHIERRTKKLLPRFHRHFLMPWNFRSTKFYDLQRAMCYLPPTTHQRAFKIIFSKNLARRKLSSCKAQAFLPTSRTYTTI